MTAFASFFRLRDPNRVSLKLSPEHDGLFYIDLDGVLPKVKENLREIPRFAIFGEIGTGKSHLLRHIEKEHAPNARFQPVYVTLSGFERRSGFAKVHTLVMQALYEPLEDIFKHGPLHAPGAVKWIEDTKDLDPDLRHALRKLVNASLDRAERSAIWAWLKGLGLTSPQAIKQGFSGRLLDYAGPTQLVDVWKQLGNFYDHHEGRRLLLLFDEGQSIQDNLSDAGLHQLADGFRHLLDEDNRSIGAIFGLNLPRAKRMHPFMRADVLRRHDSKIINLRPIGDAERALRFYKEYWAYLAAPGAPALLDERALAFVGEHLVDLREWQSRGAYMAINRQATQADLLEVLDYIARTALQKGQKPPLSAESVQQWFGGVGQ